MPAIDPKSNNPADIGINDVLGNYSLTLIDSLSTLAILAGGPDDEKYTGSQALSDFQDGVAQFVLYYGDGRHGPSGQGIRSRGFDLDSKVQVFETVIRGVGGLLSAHLFAVGDLPIRATTRKLIPRRRVRSLETAPITWPGAFDMTASSCGSPLIFRSGFYRLLHQNGDTVSTRQSAFWHSFLCQLAIASGFCGRGACSRQR